MTNNKLRVAESKSVTRMPTTAEKEAKRGELYELAMLDKRRAEIEKMPQGDERAREAVALEREMAAIDAMLDEWRIQEWVNEYRDLTDTEIAEREKLASEAKRDADAAKAARKEIKERADKVMARLGITKDDLRDLIAEVNDGGE